MSNFLDFDTLCGRHWLVETQKENGNQWLEVLGSEIWDQYANNHPDGLKN